MKNLKWIVMLAWCIVSLSACSSMQGNPNDPYRSQGEMQSQDLYQGQ
jgi:hypothetical protein